MRRSLVGRLQIDLDRLRLVLCDDASPFERRVEHVTPVRVETRPNWYARSAVIGCPVKIMSIAGARPMSRGSRMIPPASAASPHLTSATANDDLVVATTRSHDSTISQPPDVAKPSTAATIGLVRG